MKLFIRKYAIAFLAISLTVMITLDIEPALGQVQDLKLRHEAIAAHFLYVTKPLIDSIDIVRQGSQRGLRHRDITEDVYNAFLRIAEDTGGVTESSANVSRAFQKAAFASENYYLLYYSPSDYKTDGKFRNIRVSVKGKNYRVNHRAGYIAD
jgi:hypothetical protein